MATKEQLIDSWGDWLAGFDWDLFATLTFPGHPTKKKASRRFEQWITGMEAEIGTRNFRYVQVLERGAFKDNVHFHVLIGGLKGGSRPDIWKQKWEDMAGQAAVSRFDKRKGGIYYLLKTLLPDRDFEITLRLREDVVSERNSKP